MYLGTILAVGVAMHFMRPMRRDNPFSAI
jgi:hypothetical protein